MVLAPAREKAPVAEPGPKEQPTMGKITHSATRGKPSSGIVSNESRLDEYISRLDDLGVDHSAPTAADLGFSDVTDDDVECFIACLKDHAPSRIETVIFPSIDFDRTNFVKFIMMAFHPGLEESLIKLRRKRGRQFKAAVRKRIKGGEESSENAAAFDTTRMGLTGTNLSLLLVAREYVRFRAGVELRPAEWQAIADAVHRVNPKYSSRIDGKNLARNLCRFAAARPNLMPPGRRGWRSVEIVERCRLVITAQIDGRAFIVK